jgi:hypothetical protein
MMTESRAGYYDVKVMYEGEIIVHRVYALSDYAAAIQVRENTGLMPQSQVDVEFIRAGSR